MSIAVLVHKQDLPTVEQFIQDGDFPTRLRLALVIVGVSDRADCVYRRSGRGLRCVKEEIYPLNRLRNIAIRNTLTSHFVVFDMDMWPASGADSLVSLLENAYATLTHLPPSFLANPYNVMIVPAFSLPASVLNPRECKSLQTCIETYLTGWTLTARAMKFYPETKRELITCIKKRGCTIFRPQSLTHVPISHSLSF